MQFIGTLEAAKIAGVKQGTVRDWCSEKKDQRCRTGQARKSLENTR